MSTQQKQVKIVTDSAADIPAELAQALDITVVPLLVHMGGKSYRDGIDISGEAFYRELERVIADPAVKVVPIPGIRPPSPASSIETEMFRAMTRRHRVPALHRLPLPRGARFIPARWATLCLFRDGA